MRPTRPGPAGAARNSGTSRSVNRNGPTTWLATVCSMPCGETPYVASSAPAACTSASTRSCRSHDLSGGAADRVQVASVGDHDLDTAGSTCRAQATAHAACLALVAGDDDDGRSVGGERLRSGDPSPDVAPVRTTTRPVRS